MALAIVTPWREHHVTALRHIFGRVLPFVPAALAIAPGAAVASVPVAMSDRCSSR
jgi:hypothetical protein